jgi:hypothetical protein
VADAVLEELGRRAIEAKIDVLARFEARCFDGLHAKIERCLGREQVWGKAALVAPTLVSVAGLLQRAFQGMEDLRPCPQGLREALRADWQDHELLKVDRIIGMGAAIDDIHHRDGQNPGRRPHIAVKRQLACLRRRLGDGQRHAEDRVRPEPRLVGRAVERDHRLVDFDLVLGIETANGVEDVAIDAVDSVQHALAHISGHVAVTQFDSLVSAGRSAGRHGGAAERAILQHHVDLDGRVPRLSRISRATISTMAVMGRSCPFRP